MQTSLIIILPSFTGSFKHQNQFTLHFQKNLNFNKNALLWVFSVAVQNCDEMPLLFLMLLPINLRVSTYSVGGLDLEVLRK